MHKNELYTAALDIIAILEEGKKEFFSDGLFIKMQTYFPQTAKFFSGPENGYYSYLFKSHEGLKKYVLAIQNFNKELEENFNGISRLLKNQVIPPLNENILYLYKEAKLSQCKNKREIYENLILTLSKLTQKKQDIVISEMRKIGNRELKRENEKLVRYLEECLAK